MSQPPSYDDDLLARLNRLKQSSISLDQQKLQLNDHGEAPSYEDVLSSRLRSLRNNTASTISNHMTLPQVRSQAPAAPISRQGDAVQYVTPDLFSQEDIGLPNIFRGTNPAPSWTVPELRPETVGELSKKADELLARMQEHQKTSRARSANHLYAISAVSNAESAKAQADADGLFEHDDLEDGTQEAEELLAQLIDEVALEAKEDNEHANANNDATKSPMTTTSDKPPEAGSNSVLPSAPTELKDLPAAGFEDEIALRMAALTAAPTTTLDSLGLPSAPTALPRRVSGHARTPPRPKEPEDWCCVCYDTGTVLCHDCDDAFYCARCWKEGHRDCESRMHEWSNYRRPR